MSRIGKSRGTECRLMVARNWGEVRMGSELESYWVMEFSKAGYCAIW